MNTEFDVVIIGGGIYGCTCAYFLSKAKKKVLLIEKDKIGGAGATSFSRGIVRVYDEDQDLAEVSLLGAKEFNNWENNNYPNKTPYTNSGFLYLMEENKEKTAINFINKYSSEEYPIQLLRKNEIREKFPWLSNLEGKIGVFEVKGGYGNPSHTAINFANGFKENGGVIFENFKIENFNQNNNGTWEIKLPETNIMTKVVLLTVGAYAKNFINQLPIYTRSISLSQYYNDKAIEIALIDEKVETYLRPTDGNSFYCGSNVFEIVDNPDLLKPKDNLEHKDSNNRLKKVISTGEDYKLVNYFKGYDSYTEEKKPIVEFIKKGLYVATGFSGRGYKCSISLSKQITNELTHYLETNQVITEVKWKINKK
jgi:glycine/D-amino acid oxidase-like deaminating enzyme